MIEARRQPQELPAAPTLLCMLGASWIGSIAGLFISMMSKGGASAYMQPQGRLALVLVAYLLPPLISAIAVKHLLQRFVGCDVGFGIAFGAFLAGTLVGMLAQFGLGTAVSIGGNQVLYGATAFFLVFGLVGTAVSYLVLRQAHPIWLNDRLAELHPYLDDDGSAPAPATFEHTGYNECVSAVRETATGLVDAATHAHLDEVADVVLNGLPYLDSAFDALQLSTPPPNAPEALHRELVASVSATREELLAAARKAAVGEDTRLRLADSEGMRNLRQTLHELAERGIATDW